MMACSSAVRSRVRGGLRADGVHQVGSKWKGFKVINYKIPAPTSYEFLKSYLKQVLNIGTVGKSKATQYEKKEQLQALPDKGLSVLVEKMSLYLSLGCKSFRRLKKFDCERLEKRN